MQEVIAIAKTATGLKEFLEQYASDFFDSITADPSATSTRTTTVTKNGIEVPIVDYIQGSSANNYLAGVSTTILYSGTQYNRISGAFVFDDKIFLMYNTPGSDTGTVRWFSFILITKNANGDTVIATIKNNSGYDVASISEPPSGFRVWTYTITDSGAKSFTNCTYPLSNGINVINTMPFQIYDGTVLNGLYLCTARPFASQEYPFEIRINDKLYALLCFNSILIEE